MKQLCLILLTLSCLVSCDSDKESTDTGDTDPIVDLPSTDADEDADADTDADADADADADDSGSPGDDTASDDTGGSDPETADASTSERTGCMAPPPATDATPDDPPVEPESGRIPNEGMKCTVTSEVNWKIDEDMIEGGPDAKTLRNCIIDIMEVTDDGEGDKCQTAGGYTENDLCWAALLAAEVTCGGPAVEEDKDDEDSEPPPESEDEPTTTPPSLWLGGGGVMGLTSGTTKHSVTVNESPDSGHAGDWKIRDSHPGCENVQLSITMSGDPLCISACTPDPAAKTQCCDDLSGWCFSFFRKLKRKTTAPADEDPVEPL